MKSDLTRSAADKDVVSTSRLVRKMLKNWHWMLIAIVVGSGGSYLFSLVYRPTYASTSTVLISTEQKGQGLMSLFAEQGLWGMHNSNLASQLEIIKSFSLNVQTVRNLNWQKSIYADGLFGRDDMYMHEPFTVDVTNYDAQAKGVPIQVRFVSATEVEVQANHVSTLNGLKLKVAFRETIKVGDSFSNEHFSFAIHKVPGIEPELGKDYILVFNSLENLADAYMERLDVSLANQESNVVRLTLKGKQPYRDANYLNELTKVYMEFGLEERNRMTDNALRFINAQMTGIADSLESSSKSFTEFRSRNRVVDLSQEASVLVASLEQIEGQEVASRMKQEYYGNLLKYLDDAEQMREITAPSVVGITDPNLNSLVIKLSDLYGQREVLSYTVQEKNPNLIALDNEILYVKKQLREAVSNLSGNATVESSILLMRKQRVNDQLAQLPKTEQDLIDIKRNFDLNSELYTFLMRKKAEVGIEKASNNAEARVIDLARINLDAPIGPTKVQIVLLGAVAGLALGALYFLLVVRYGRSLEEAADVEANTDLMVVGKILTNRFKTELPVIQYPNSAITESYRNLRTSLYNMRDRSATQVLAVHSTTVGEGKSFTAANLASVLAINNERVLLIEADLKKPRLQTIFSISKEVGLSTFLSGKSPLQDIIFPTRIKGLSFIPSGPTPTFSSELLGNGMLAKLIEMAKESYSYIVLDSVPTDILNDALIIGSVANVNLYVVRVNKSSLDELESAERLRNEGKFKNLALIINDIRPRVSKKKLKEYGYS